MPGQMSRVLLALSAKEGGRRFSSGIFAGGVGYVGVLLVHGAVVPEILLSSK
jgi:hypothetical protein